MLTRPKNQDPLSWAEFNAALARIPTVRLVEIEPEMRLDAIRRLQLRVRRAANELEGQGAKSDRIAAQLLTALADFAKETEA